MAGAPKELLDEWRAENEKCFEVYEENWEAVIYFIKLFTQWNIEQGFYIGLNYQSINLMFDLYSPQNRKEIFEGIQVMEQEALKILNSRDK